VFLLTIFAADFNHLKHLPFFGSIPSQDTNSSQMRVAVGEDMKVFGGFTDFTKYRIHGEIRRNEPNGEVVVLFIFEMFGKSLTVQLWLGF